MAKKQLHPSVQQFKEFVKANPALIKTVRSGQRTWQELYEEWFLLGESDPHWSQFETRGNENQRDEQVATEPNNVSEKKDWMSQVIGTMKNMDPNQMQSHIANLSSALGAIQGVIASFQGGNVTQESERTKQVSPPSHPFQFRQD